MISLVNKCQGHYVSLAYCTQMGGGDRRGSQTLLSHPDATPLPSDREVS